MQVKNEENKQLPLVKAISNIGQFGAIIRGKLYEVHQVKKNTLGENLYLIQTGPTNHKYYYDADNFEWIGHNKLIEVMYK